MELTIDQALQHGVAAHKEGKLQDAERLYRAILQSQPLHPDANHNLGVLAVAANKTDAALPLFKNALEANPKIEQFWLSYIDALIKEEQCDDAAQVFEQAKKQGVTEEKLNILGKQLALIVKAARPSLSEQKKGSTFSGKGKQLAEQKKRKKIARKQILEGNNPSQQQLSTLSEYYRSGRFNDAKNLAVSITNEFPKYQFAWKVLGAVLSQLGRISESAIAKEKAVKFAPNDAEAHSNLGNTLKELGRLDEAVASYSQAIALKPDFAEAHSNLGNTLQELGRLVEAEASYTQAIAFKPDYAKAHSNLGNTLQELGKLDEAVASYTQAISLEPDYAEAHSNLGVTLHELGRLDEAEASYTQTIALKADYAVAHSNLGVTLHELGRLDEAKASFTQAISLKPEYAEAFYNRSRLLFDKAEYEAALRDADACISKKARVLPLISLYALGRIDEIYKRIEIQSKIDGEDMNIAAFAAFISELEKKPTAYNFCSNPIDFIHNANLSSHVSNLDTYLGDVIEELNNIEAVWEPFGTTTVKGFQSPRHVNIFANPAGKLELLKSIILKELDAYYLKFRSEQCTYIQEFPATRNLFGWSVILKQQGHQDAHIHTSGWLSGVIYLKVVPSLGKDEGAIEFSLNGKNYSDSKSPELLHQPAQGDIVFFPSSLYHRTIPFTTDADRIIVSFDLIPEVRER
jgi:tetratricopeptide (TPR) repeat protein